MAVFSTLLAEREDYENRCEALTIENQGTSAWASAAKGLREKLVGIETVDTASKAAPN